MHDEDTNEEKTVSVISCFQCGTIFWWSYEFIQDSSHGTRVAGALMGSNVQLNALNAFPATVPVSPLEMQAAQGFHKCYIQYVRFKLCLWVHILFAFFWCFSGGGTFPCYLLNFGAKRCHVLQSISVGAVWSYNLSFALFICFSMVFIDFSLAFTDFPLFSRFVYPWRLSVLRWFSSGFACSCWFFHCLYFSECFGFHHFFAGVHRFLSKLL